MATKALFLFIDGEVVNGMVAAQRDTFRISGVGVLPGPDEGVEIRWEEYRRRNPGEIVKVELRNRYSFPQWRLEKVFQCQVRDISGGWPCFYRAAGVEVDPPGVSTK